MIVSFIGGYLTFHYGFIIPVLGLLTFGIAYISVFGFRASLISFSGLLALVISFAVSPKDLNQLEYSLLVGLGGLFHLLLVVLAHQINPQAELKESLSETFQLTARLLKIRGKLVGSQKDRTKLQSQLLKVQSQLIEKHETVRDILSAPEKGKAARFRGKQTLIFVQLVEMLETAVANPVDYDKMDQVLKNQESLQPQLQKIIFEIAEQLQAAQKANLEEAKNSLNELLVTLKTNIASVEKKDNYEDFVILNNLSEYQEKQLEKLRKIQKLQQKQDLEDDSFINLDVIKRFLIPQNYDLSLLMSNFTLHSLVFKHSLRLAVTMMAGYAIGHLFDFQNPYWILLTIIVIMRPSYGLTKSRSKDRIVGTLIGAVLAASTVFFIDNIYVYGVIGLLSLVIAFSTLQKNYTASAVFVTLSVVFVYAIIAPDVLQVIEFRILDTLLGSTLSFMAILWLWPAWGLYKIQEKIKESVLANKAYFDKVAHYYQEKGEVPISLKVSRKKAFQETANLNGAFQKMAQEPKSKQIDLGKIYELVMLNHTLLSSLSSLSTYLQTHETTPASGYFETAVKLIDYDLEQVSKALFKKKNTSQLNYNSDLATMNEELSNLNFSDIENMVKREAGSQQDYQEAHLVWQQLRWLHGISKQMVKVSSQLSLN